MRKVLVLQHAEPETPGEIATALEAEGFKIQTVRPYAGEPIPVDIGRASGLVFMGGPMSVDETDRYPFLAQELRLLERALEWEIPILGVCLGSQLLAAALGARVAKGPAREIGWHSVRLTENAVAKDALWKRLPESFDAFHWHGDVFDLPDGATPLASSHLTPHQAFRYGRNAYGLLFHIEVTADHVAAMCGAFPEELAETGQDAFTVQKDAERHLPALRPIRETVFRRWAGLLDIAPATQDAES